MDKKQKRFLGGLFAAAIAAGYSLGLLSRPSPQETINIVAIEPPSQQTTSTSTITSTTIIPDATYEFDEAREALRERISKAASAEEEKISEYVSKALNIYPPERDQYGDSISEQERYRRDMKKFCRKKIEHLNGALKYVTGLDLNKNRSTIYDAMMEAMEGYSTMEELRLMEKALSDVSSARNAGEFREAIPATMMTDELSFNLDKLDLRTRANELLYGFDIDWHRYLKGLRGAEIDDTDYRVIRADIIDSRDRILNKPQTGIKELTVLLAKAQKDASELLTRLRDISR